jgi:hypothetical protein
LGLSKLTSNPPPPRRQQLKTQKQKVKTELKDICGPALRHPFNFESNFYALGTLLQKWWPTTVNSRIPLEVALKYFILVV